METKIARLFAVADGAGVRQGLVEAPASWVLAAWAIAVSLKRKSRERHLDSLAIMMSYAQNIIRR